MEPQVLIITDRSDLAETRLIIGLARHGLPVRVLANDTGRHYDAFVDAGIPVTPLRLSGRFDRIGTETIRKSLQGSSISVIYAFNPRAIACAIRASRGLNVKIMGYRGVIGNIGLAKPESWLTFLHPRLDRIVCVSDAVKRSLEQLRLPFKASFHRKLVRIYKGHDPAWYELPPADLSAFPIFERDFVICAIGRDRPGKGFSTLIEAMRQVPDTLNIKLLMVGDFEGNQRFREQVASLPDPERVMFAGYRPDAPQVAGACDALVLPSESEGLPRVVIEAMAYQRPVIVTEAGGMPELVRHNQEGLIVPVRDSQALAESIIYLATHPDERTEMGRRGRERVATSFHVEKTVEKTVQLIRELMV